MPDYRRRNCAEPPRGCGKNITEVGPISWRGLCMECGYRRANVNFDALTSRSGVEFTRWRAGMAACVGGVLLDDAPPRP